MLFSEQFKQNNRVENKRKSEIQLKFQELYVKIPTTSSSTLKLYKALMVSVKHMWSAHLDNSITVVQKCHL